MAEETHTTRPDDLDSAVWTHAPVFLNCLARRMGGRSGNSGYPGLTPMEKDALAVVWTFCRRDRGRGLFYMSEETLGDHLGMAGENRRQSAGRLLKSLVGKGLLVRGVKVEGGQFSYIVNAEGVLSMLLRLGWRLEPVGESLRHVYDPKGAGYVLDMMSAQPMLGALTAMRLYANKVLQTDSSQDEHRDTLPDEYPDARGLEHSNALPVKYPNTHELEHSNAHKRSLDKDTESIHQKEQRKRSAPPTLDEVRSFFAKNGITATNPDRFWSYYDALGWCTTQGNPIGNWQQKARQWEAEDRLSDRPTGSTGADTARQSQNGASAQSKAHAPSIEEVVERYCVNREQAAQLISRGLV